MKTLFLLSLFSSLCFAQQTTFSLLKVGDHAPINASSIFEAKSTSLGVLFPRMTTTQKNAIASPATGLLVFDTTLNQYSFYNGTIWSSIGGGGGSVTSVTASPPLSSSGGTTPNISETLADTSTDGYLSATDWNTFNNKQQTITIGAFGATPNNNGLLLTSSAGGTIATFVTGTDETAATTASSTWHGQGFKPTSTANLNDVKIFIRNAGTTPSGTMTLNIYSDNSGVPGTLLATSSPLNVSVITGSYAAIQFTFGSPLAVTSGVQYYWALDSTNIVFTGGVQINFQGSLTGGYADGTNVLTINSGSSWITAPGKDLNFIAEAIATGSVLIMEPADATHSGGLTFTDWNTFNNKQPAGSYVLTSRNINTTSPLTGGGDLSADRTIAIPVATSSVNGYLSSADWSTFNNKQSALSFGNLTDSGTDGITVTGGTGAVIGSGTSLSQHVADSTHNGYLLSTDWTTFNNKQPAGNYITALTGDGTATGPGSAAFTLATVNGNVGSFGSSTSIPSFTVNAKGLITAASGNVVIAPAGTLTGTTLASNVVSSSLTSVGTITTGVWNGTTIAIANGGTGQTTKAAAFDALSPMTTQYDLIIGGASGTGTRLPKGANNTHLTTDGSGVVAWTTDPTPYTISTITGTTSAVCGTTYLADTSGGSFTVTLPAPTNGCFVGIVDAKGTFDTNNLTLAPNGGEKINYLAASSVLQTYGFSHVFFTQGTDWFMQ